MHKPWSLVVPALALALAGAAAVGCSSNSSSGADAGANKPCNENGGSCPDGQTCWPQNGSTFACLNAGPGKAGEPCENTPGAPTCGHGLACLQTTAAGGTCLAYCDPTNPAEACPSGDTCTTAVLGGLGGPQFSVCIPPTIDAGSDSGSSSGGNDAGSSSGGNDAASSSDGGDAAASDAAGD